MAIKDKDEAVQDKGRTFLRHRGVSAPRRHRGATGATACRKEPRETRPSEAGTASLGPVRCRCSSCCTATWVTSSAADTPAQGKTGHKTATGRGGHATTSQRRDGAPGCLPGRVTPQSTPRASRCLHPLCVGDMQSLGPAARPGSSAAPAAG